MSFSAGTKRSDLAIRLTSETFYLSLSPSVTASPSASFSAFLRISSRQYWSAIDLASSSMTFDAGKAVLELDLAKAEPNTRWPSVFSPPDDEEDEDEEVPETISASTLAAVRETFNVIRTREPGEPEGNHAAIPALLREEMDFDLEDGEDFGEAPEGIFGDQGGGGKVGREVLVGFVKEGVPSWSTSPISVLSTSLKRPEIIIKSGVDGLLFAPPTSGHPSSVPWTHTATSPALAFVLSSKKDLRGVRHLTTSSGTTVLAFDAGSSATAAGNVYVYYPPKSGTWAKQGVVKVSGAERGALLGVGSVVVEGEDTVIALCEKELAVLQGVV